MAYYCYVPTFKRSVVSCLSSRRLLGWCIWGRYVAIVQRHRFAVGRGWTRLIEMAVVAGKNMVCHSVQYGSLVLEKLDNPGLSKEV